MAGGATKDSLTQVVQGKYMESDAGLGCRFSSLDVDIHIFGIIAGTILDIYTNKDYSLVPNIVFTRHQDMLCPCDLTMGM